MRKRDRSKNTGFTLLEIIIVCVILLIVMSFSAVNYKKSIDMADERAALHSLELIREAVQLYKATHGDYPPAPLDNITAINTTLGLNIMSSNLSFYCRGNNVIDDYRYSCAAQRGGFPPNDWALHFGTFDKKNPPPSYSLHYPWDGVVHCYDYPGDPYTKPCPSCPHTTAGCSGAN